MIEPIIAPSLWWHVSAAIGIDILIKATILIALMIALDVILSSRGRVLLRSALWNATLLGLILLPVSTLTLPPLRIPCLPPLPVEQAPETATEPQPIQDQALSIDTVRLYTFDPTASTDNNTVPDAAPAMSEEAATAPVVGEPASPLPPPSASHAEVVPTWFALLATIYGLGLIVCLIRVFCALLAVERLRRNCVPISDDIWIPSLHGCRSLLGIPQEIRLARSRHINVPLTFGWRRPVVLIPTTLERMTAEQSEAILLHELAHIRRNDYFWQLLLRITQAFYWPHPLIWPIARSISTVREEACDDLCAYHSHTPAVYRSALLRVASTLVRRPVASLGIAMARSSNVADRLSRIERGHRAAQCLARRPLRLAIGGIALLAVAAVGAAQLARTERVEDPPATQPAIEAATATQPATTNEPPASQPSIATVTNNAQTQPASAPAAESQLPDSRDEETRLHSELTALLVQKKQLVDSQHAPPGATRGVDGDTLRAMARGIVQTEQEKLQYKALFDNLSGPDPSQIVVSPEMMIMIQQDPRVSALEQSKAQLEQQKAALVQQNGPDHRTVRAIQDKLNLVDEQLREARAKKEKEVRDYQVNSAYTRYLNAMQTEVQLRERMLEQEARQREVDKSIQEFRRLEDKQQALMAQLDNLQAQQQLKMTPLRPGAASKPSKISKPSAASAATVVIDAGHGGRDPGAKDLSGLPEKSITLDIARKLEKALIGRVAKVVLTRTDDKFIALQARTELADQAQADLFISIHAASSQKSDAAGCTLYLAPQASDKSVSIAQSIRTALNTRGITCREIQRANFKLLVGQTRPALLIEAGFVTNAGDAAHLNDEKYREELAQTIAAGIIRSGSLQEAGASQPADTPRDEVIRVGDQLSIRIRDFLQRDAETEFTPTVDELGRVFIPQLGSIRVLGQSLDALKEEVSRRVQAAGILRENSVVHVSVRFISPPIGSASDRRVTSVPAGAGARSSTTSPAAGGADAKPLIAVETKLITLSKASAERILKELAGRTGLPVGLGQIMTERDVDWLVRETQQSTSAALIDAPRMVLFDGKEGFIQVGEQKSMKLPVDGRPKETATANVFSGRCVRVTGTSTPDRRDIDLAFTVRVSTVPHVFPAYEDASVITSTARIGDGQTLLAICGPQMCALMLDPGAADPVKRVPQPVSAANKSAGDKELVLALIKGTLINPRAAGVTEEPLPQAVPSFRGPRGVYYVLGSVKQPGAYSLPNEGLTVRQAIAAAGGVEKKLLSKRATCNLSRRGELGERKVITLDLRSILDGKVKDMTLEASDLLTIAFDGRPATDWRDEPMIQINSDSEIPQAPDAILPPDTQELSGGSAGRGAGLLLSATMAGQGTLFFTAQRSPILVYPVSKGDIVKATVEKQLLGQCKSRLEINGKEVAQATYKATDYHLFFSPGTQPVPAPSPPPAEPQSQTSRHLLKGIVLQPDGKPAIGAEVCIAGEDSMLSFSGVRREGHAEGRVEIRHVGRSGSEVDVIKSSATGEFSLRKVKGSFLVLVTHETGYAELEDRDFLKSPRIQLNPWGRLEGVSLAGSQPTRNDKIMLSYNKWMLDTSLRMGLTGRPHTPRIELMLEGSTDGDGRFVFDRVPPAVVRIERLRKLAGGGFVPDSGAGVEVKPGETARITIGGPGRTVTGRFVLAKTVPNPIDWPQMAVGSIRAQARPLELFPSRSQRQKWDDDSAKLPSYQLSVDAEGRFQVPGIPAGKYDLSMVLLSRPSGKEGSPIRQVATLNYRFTVPEIADGSSDEPLDLGDLTLKPE